MGLVSKEDRKALILSLAKARGAGGFTTDEAEQVIAWAHSVKAGELLLELVLENRALVNIRNGEICFDSMDGSGLDSTLPAREGWAETLQKGTI